MSKCRNDRFVCLPSNASYGIVNSAVAKIKAWPMLLERIALHHSMMVMSQLATVAMPLISACRSITMPAWSSVQMEM